MGFTTDSLKGYEKGKRYEKKLEFDRMFGNARQRHIVMKDEDGVELLWTTNDYTKAYKNFRIKWVYRFTIDHIIAIDIGSSIPQINIRNLTLVEQKG